VNNLHFDVDVERKAYLDLNKWYTQETIFNGKRQRKREKEKNEIKESIRNNIYKRQDKAQSQSQAQAKAQDELETNTTC